MSCTSLVNFRTHFCIMLHILTISRRHYAKRICVGKLFPKSMTFAGDAISPLI